MLARRSLHRLVRFLRSTVDQRRVLMKYRQTIRGADTGHDDDDNHDYDNAIATAAADADGVAVAVVVAAVVLAAAAACDDRCWGRCR
jgi:hypothetical protein